MTYGVFPAPAGPPGPPGPAGVDLLAYGSWSRSTTLAISTGIAATVADYDTATIAPVNMHLAAGTQITADVSGIYEFQVSPQANIPGGVGSVVTFWPRTGPVGPNNVPNSASTVELGNNHRFSLPFVSYVIPLFAGEWVEFLFHGVGDSPRLFAAPASAGPPSIPAEPAIIVTAKRIGPIPLPP